jgi:hypothetical protein
MNQDFEKWRKEGKHLPEFLRDFHNQKDLFKFIHETTNLQTHELVKDINSIEGHAYSIDVFLFILAKYGYTLQKSRANFDFKDLPQTLQQQNKIRNQKFFDLVSNFRNQEDKP